MIGHLLIVDPVVGIMDLEVTLIARVITAVASHPRFGVSTAPLTAGIGTPRWRPWLALSRAAGVSEALGEFRYFFFPRL